METIKHGKTDEEMNEGETNEEYDEQEAQLLLGWPTHGAKSIYLEVKIIEGVRYGKHNLYLSGIPLHAIST